MIVKIVKGGDMAGAVRYLHSDKEGVRREDPRIIGGLGRDGVPLGPENAAEVAGELDAARALHGTEVTVPVRDAEKQIVGHQDAHVWTCSLTLPEADRVLDDAEWRQIAEKVMTRVDLGDVRWIAVRHGVNASGCDHVHIVASGVQTDGSKARYFQDWDRASAAANAAEKEHGLVLVEGRELGIGDRGASRGELAIMEKQGRSETTRQYYARAARGCLAESRNPEEFAERMARGGLRVDYVQHGGRTGWKVTGPDGIGYAGGKLARDLSYPRLMEHWRQAGSMETADQAARVTAGRLAARSIRSEPEGHPGPLARESREIGRYAQTRASASLVLPVAVAQLLRHRIRAAEQEAEHQRELEARPPARARTADRDRGIGI